MIGVATIVVDQIVTTVVGVATIVVFCDSCGWYCDNCEHCDNRDHIYHISALIVDYCIGAMSNYMGNF